MDPIIVIGSGFAGYTVASEYRKLDKTRQVILVTRDTGDFYSKPMLSIAFAQRKSVEQLINTHADAMAGQLDLTCSDAQTRTASIRQRGES
jgi:rubredoxin-NAD+ reductase